MPGMLTCTGVTSAQAHMAAAAAPLSHHIVLNSPWEVLHAEHSGAGAVKCLAEHIHIIRTSTSTLGHAQTEKSSQSEDVTSAMLQVWNPENSAEEVLVMVCRTGLNTAMGSTIRELLVPAKVTKRDPVVAVCGQHFRRQHVKFACLHTLCS